MKRPLDKMDPNRYRFVENYEPPQPGTESDYRFAIVGLGIILFFAWVSTF